MPEPGDVVVCEFAGAVATKRRPLVVVSSDIYHKTRPDVRDWEAVQNRLGIAIAIGP